ncbi:hypothetical protein GOODEAATRI_014902 [Goodea atripinnis]|uniref:LYR motif-containing protein 1 n=1 Tax=Goodea atripinnis TaxID=208336 RepID=A0ABV0NAQ9_9TELE
MTLSTRSAVLSLYMRVFRIARAWQAQTGIMSDTEAERKYIVQEARTLFRQNQQTYLPPLGLATQKGRKLRGQQRLRKQAKPVYLQSHDET